MSNIREVEFAKPKQNDDIVQMLEEWLDRARAGDVQVMALVGVKPDATISTEWRGLTGGGLHELISGISVLNYRVLSTNIEPG